MNGEPFILALDICRYTDANRVLTIPNVKKMTLGML